jgi:hypothetical protein
MAWFSRFNKLWATNGVTAEPSDTNQDLGFGYLGVNPPSVEMFNALIQNLDAKDNWLYNRLAEVIIANGNTPSQTTANQLLDALRGLFAPNIRSITATANFVVPSNVTRIRAKCWGGGGGGGGSLSGGAGSGGGGGGYTEGVFTVVPGASIFVTIGAGGNGAPSANPFGGQAGGTTSFGSFCSASGGSAGVGGNVNASSTIANGGSGFGGTLNFSGLIGGLTQNYPQGGAGSGSGTAGGGGVGGSSPFGGSLSHLSIQNAGNPGVFPGGGGGGAGALLTGSIGASAGGVGAAGLCLLEY